MARNYTVSFRIQRPVTEVYDALISRDKLRQYFIDEASGDLETGADISWRWKDYHATLPVHVTQLESDRSIELTLSSRAWEKTTDTDYPVTTRFEFEAASDGETLLQISEEGWRTDREGLKGSHDNCGGWTHMAMCLKAWIEHGIDLR